MRRLQSAFERARTHSIVCQGDSLTDPTANMGGEWLRWTEVLRRELEKLGARVVVRNLGQSGAKTDDLGKGMLRRFSPFLCGIPEIGVLWGGTNDIHSVSALTSAGGVATAVCPGHGYSESARVVISGSAAPGYDGLHLAHPIDVDRFQFSVADGLISPAGGTIRACCETKRNLRAMIRWLAFGCRGCVRSVSELPAGGVEGDRYVVLVDGSNTGGRSPVVPGSVADDEPTAWEYRTGASGEAGWGRIGRAGTPASHCGRIVVAGQHYLNYSSGGDSLLSPYGLFDDTSGVRSFQIGAANAEGALYADLYEALRRKIVDGIEQQGSHSWHIADQNVHLSALGHRYVGEFLARKVAEKPGWLEVLSS